MNPHSSTPAFLPKRVGLRSFTRWALSATVALAAVPATFAQPGYVLTELPTPAGYTDCLPYGINDQGFVTGSSTRVNDSALVATVWKNGAVSTLGRLKEGTYSLATAVNSKGVVVGEGDDGDSRPLGWITSGSSLVNFFSNNGGNTHPVAINDAGEVGGYYVKGFSSTWRGAIWKVDAKDPRKSVKIDLPILPGGDLTSSHAVPFAFNKIFQAAGYCSNSDIGQHATLWQNDAAHTVVDLSVYGYDWSSTANSLNDLGQVVGSSHPPFGSRAIVWQNDAAHTPVELPLLAGDNYGSAAFINSKGTIVGSSATSEPGTWNVGPSRIVVWIDGVVYDLESLLSPAASGWKIVEVRAINNPGQIACYALRNGVYRAVVLTPVP